MTQLKSDQPHEFLLKRGVDALQRQAGYLPATVEEKLPMTFEEYRKKNKIKGGKGLQWVIENWLRTLSDWEPIEFTLGVSVLFEAARHASYWYLIPKYLKSGNMKYAWFRDYLDLSTNPEMMDYLERFV